MCFTSLCFPYSRLFLSLIGDHKVTRIGYEVSEPEMNGGHNKWRNVRFIQSWESELLSGENGERRTVRRNQPYGTGTKRLARTFIPMFHSLHSLRFRLFIPFIHMVHSLSPRNNRNKETGVKVKGREWTMRNWTEQTSDSGQVLRVLGSFNTLHSFHFIIRMRTGVSHTHEQLEQEGEGRTNWNNWTVHHSYVPFAYCVPLVHFIHSFPHSSLCL